MAQSELLMRHLVDKGIALDHIPQIVGNVVWVARNRGMFTPGRVNEQLNQMGWDHEMLDEASFQLIVSALEKARGGYGVRDHTMS